MSTRRRFTGDFKAKVALEALRGDKTIQEIATRRVLSWRLSNTLDAGFCKDALSEALDRYGRPEIFNSDQGSQFTSLEFTSVLKDAGVAISMDGRGRCMDNIFVERLWRSLKYEAVYLHELSDGFAAQRVISRWMTFYNTQRLSRSHRRGFHTSKNRWPQLFCKRLDRERGCSST